MSVPVGVLQAPAGERGAIEFEPPLIGKRNALDHLAMGPVIRMVLHLREQFWSEAWFARHIGREDVDTLSFLHTRDEDFPVWWTAYPMRVPLLVAWSGGSFAERMAHVDAPAIERRAIAALARQLRITVRRARHLVVGTSLHDWQRDPFARGAYSYQLVGGMTAPAELARPLQGTLFFAGEATDAEGATGTVHGAIATGRRAARQVMRVLG